MGGKGEEERRIEEEGGKVMVCTEQMYEQIAELCREKIEDYDARVKSAITKMDNNRCYLSTADYELNREIMNVIDEYLDNYEIDDLEYEIYKLFAK